MTQPATVACPFCAEQIQPGARVCRYCQRAVPRNCAAIVRSNGQYALGRLTGGGLAVWDMQSDAAVVARYPDNPAGLAEAMKALNTAEHNERVSLADQRRPRATMSGMAIAVIILLVVAYLLLHNAQYSKCLIQPGILSWPSVCI